MLDAIQISLALWAMIVCGGIKLAQVLHCLFEPTSPAAALHANEPCSRKRRIALRQTSQLKNAIAPQTRPAIQAR